MNIKLTQKGTKDTTQSARDQVSGPIKPQVESCVRSVPLSAFSRGHFGFPSVIAVLLCCSLTGSLAAELEHVVVIGCDGFGSVGFTKSNTPVLHRLMRQGSYTLHARGVMPTSSSPNWASMIMGAGPEQHGVTSNEWETNKFEIAPTVVGPGGIFPTVFGALRAQKPTAKIAVIHDWDGFGRLVEAGVPDILENHKGSTNTARRAVEVILKEKPTFLFVHFDDVDHAGHTFGWKSREYFETVAQVDGLIGDLLEALTQAGIREQTVVLMTADHGGKAKSHGGPTMEEIEIPWIISGPGIRRGHEIKTPVNTYDTAATIALLFKLTPPEGWIARPVREALENN
jgi:predicted AlkP superfamily pyrophosphatase or phosphodiesterase